MNALLPRFVILDLVRDPCGRANGGGAKAWIADRVRNGMWEITSLPELVERSKPSLPSTFVVCQQAGGCPAATHFLLRRQKKVSKEKATLLSASLRFASGNLRCSAQPGSSSNSLRSDNRSPWSVWTSAPRRIQKGGEAGTGSEFAIELRRGRAKRVLASPHPHLLPPPVGPGRGAQPKAGQGSRLSEPKASSSETPLLASTAGCPAAQRRGPGPSGRLFFGDFLLAKQKKVTCRRATPGQQENAHFRDSGSHGRLAK